MMLWAGVLIVGLLLMHNGLQGLSMIKHAEIVHTLPGEPPIPQTPEEFDRKQLETIRAFEHRMDSLSRDSSGRKEYDSISRARPGLMDSARTAETYYSHRLSK